MARTTPQLRLLWAPHCTGPWARVELYGDGAVTVRAAIVDAVKALDSCLVHFGYATRQLDTGAFNCRPITGGTDYSLHAYGIALDINWQSNPYGPVLITDMPPEMIAAIKAIRTRNGAQVWRWGGDYSGNKDAMHFEIVASPAEIATGIDQSSVPSSAEVIIVGAPNFSYDVRGERVPGGNRYAGWAWDPDDPSREVDIHVYYGGEMVWTGVANVPRPDLNAAVVFLDGSHLPGNHGFDFVVPPHAINQVELYVLDRDNAAQNTLMGSTKVVSRMEAGAGTPGAAGAQGPAGPAGPQGPVGATGPAGTSTTGVTEAKVREIARAEIGTSKNVPG